MFGYVRPFQDELKVRDYDLFRAAYCGVCQALRQRYGILARMILHYDFAMLALLLMDGTVPCERRRCPRHMLGKRRMLVSNPAADRAADAGILLACGKWEDAVRDEGFWKRLGARLLLFLFARKMRLAQKRLPEFYAVLHNCLDELHALEAAKSASLDAAADTFARILQALAGQEDTPPARCRRLALYHTGRFLYLLDAVDDYADDMRKGRYNPLRYRFDTEGEPLTEEMKDTLRQTLDISCAEALRALDLLTGLQGQAVLENILGLGLPAALETVMKGVKPK